MVSRYQCKHLQIVDELGFIITLQVLNLNVRIYPPDELEVVWFISVGDLDLEPVMLTFAGISKLLGIDFFLYLKDDVCLQIRC